MVTKSLRAYVMTKKALTRLTRKHGQRITCYTCGEPVSEGDRVVASCQQGRRKHKVRRKACYESTFIARREGETDAHTFWTEILKEIRTRPERPGGRVTIDR